MGIARPQMLQKPSTIMAQGPDFKNRYQVVGLWLRYTAAVMLCYAGSDELCRARQRD
ncbi:MAG: hypothetical protein JAY69_16500 [Candidatus Thiodiazotropha taylori]|nr:hypothetical protein [Candidatus Thiodiazotropha taylori]